MERRDFIKATSVLLMGLGLPIHASSNPTENSEHNSNNRKLFIYGGQFNATFTKYIIGLTGKQNPKVCFLPTASGDSGNLVAIWLETVQRLELKPYVQRCIPDQTEPFESLLLNVDAIVVGGGNTLTLLATWKALGIDLILRKAYENGIVISGGSAGSQCWFEQGLTDALPPTWTKFNGLGWIKGSHCPHYDSVISRKTLYHSMVTNRELSPGYACDDMAGIYFENEEFKNAVSADSTSKSYYVDSVDKKIRERVLETEIIK